MAATIRELRPGVPKPPRSLGKAGLALWDRVCGDYDIGDIGGQELLCLAAETLDRVERCRKQIDADGEVVKTATGARREHYLLKTELQGRAFVARTLTKLGIDAEVARPVGRPPMKLYPNA
jgi:hypothetical protein